MKQNLGSQDHSDSSSGVLAALCSPPASSVMSSQLPHRQPPLTTSPPPPAHHPHSAPRLFSDSEAHPHLQPSPPQSPASGPLTAGACLTLSWPPDILPTEFLSQLASVHPTWLATHVPAFLRTHQPSPPWLSAPLVPSLSAGSYMSFDTQIEDAP